MTDEAAQKIIDAANAGTLVDSSAHAMMERSLLALRLEAPASVVDHVQECVMEALKEAKSKPYLGNATTRELLAELEARAEVGGYAGYRTVDHD